MHPCESCESVNAVTAIFRYSTHSQDLDLSLREVISVVKSRRKRFSWSMVLSLLHVGHDSNGVDVHWRCVLANVSDVQPSAKRKHVKDTTVTGVAGRSVYNSS
jgi:hypothetical protein